MKQLLDSFITSVLVVVLIIAVAKGLIYLNSL